MKVGDLISFWAWGKKYIGLVIDDDERNHADIRFFKTAYINEDGALEVHTNYYSRIDKPMTSEAHGDWLDGLPAGLRAPLDISAGEKMVEVISESR